MKNTFATTSLNGTLGSGINGNQQIKNNESASTLDLMKAIIGESQGSGVLDRMAKCGATRECSMYSADSHTELYANNP